MTTRDMTGAPEYLLNLWLTYDLAATGIRVMTIHQAKGLEFDHVYLGLTGRDPAPLRGR